ncbi:hypothetical protein FQZ97_1085920 [compost metagenome]
MPYHHTAPVPCTFSQRILEHREGTVGGSVEGLDGLPRKLSFLQFTIALPVSPVLFAFAGQPWDVSFHVHQRRLISDPYAEAPDELLDHCVPIKAVGFLRHDLQYHVDLLGDQGGGDDRLVLLVQQQFLDELDHTPFVFLGHMRQSSLKGVG